MRITCYISFSPLNGTFEIEPNLDTPLGGKHISHNDKVKPFSWTPLKILHFVHPIKTSDERVLVVLQVKVVVFEYAVQKIEFLMGDGL